MRRDLEIECRCSKVHGSVRGLTPRTSNRAVCYCDDCQAFVHYLGRADLLDAHGGSDIVQVPPALVTFDRGMDAIAAIRLSPKGLFRWYATCCKTPLGNTVLPSIPFIGFVYEAFRDARDPATRNDVLGPTRGRTWGKFAISSEPIAPDKVAPGFLLRSVAGVLSWKLRGRSWPNPFFERSGQPKYPVTILTREQRDALRPLCGPKVAAPADQYR
jgi:hypothetical protein